MLSHYQYYLLPLCRIADIPDGHVGAGNDRETNGSGETLVTLRIIVLEADLKLDSFEEVPLLCLERVLEEFLDVRTHSGCGAKGQSLLASNILHSEKGLSYRL
jgi:hypothetical protein